ncbi:MAG: glucose-6-phosphate isomerase [Candidatus Sumerlaeia bacterium]|nr:glucose-6-phosphate isomerase [Candidatus Sumerlaeia bacterium]
MPICIEFDYNNAMAEVVGPRHGLTRQLLEDLKERAAKSHKAFLERRATDVGFFKLANTAGRAKELQELAALGDSIAAACENFVILGIGGSALGPACVQRALGHLYYNLLDKAGRNNRPRIFVLDNIDPEFAAELSDVAPPENTCYNVITKSGTTPETLSQFMAFYDCVAAKVGPQKAKEHFVITTNEVKSPLLPLARDFGFRFCTMPDSVGGRFSELTAVGLLPAAVAGFNIVEMVRGAEAAAAVCDSPDLFANPAYLNGAIHYLADTVLHKNISVMMPYSEALRDVADWYRQLWAESLGKRRGEKPHEVCVGQTPVRALGTTDQHSQVQLYVDGPNDKIFTFLCVKKFRREFPVTGGLNAMLQGYEYLSGRDIQDLFEAEFIGTEYALKLAERPSVRITLERVDEAHIGGLLFFLMVQTAFAGMLYGINPFDQPGVETGKNVARALMKGEGSPDAQWLADIRTYQRERLRYPAVAIRTGA